MATLVIMPRQGQSVESCIITKWHKAEGDSVKADEILFSYETDKSSFDEVAPVDGTLLKILRPEDDDVPCLENVCIIGAPGEDVSALVGADAPAAEAKAEEKAEAPVEAAPAAVVAAPVKTERDDSLFASPRARNLADKLGIDYKLATPTGAENRVIERDIEALAKSGIMNARNAAVEEAAPVAAPIATAAPVEAPAYVDEKIPNIRKVISKAMHNSLQSTAQLTLSASFDCTQVNNFRAAIKPMIEKGEINKITINDIVMYVVSRVLTRHRDLNANMLDDKMRYFTDVNLGMAVDTPRGLLVPTLFKANKLTLNEMSGQLKALAKEAQGGTISPDKLSGGSFTVSNLGTFGVESFTPVLNAPQTGILGVCTISQKIKVVGGEIKAYPAMGLSLTFDHRAVDGAPAAKFLKEVCDGLENFMTFVALN